MLASANWNAVDAVGTVVGSAATVGGILFAIYRRAKTWARDLLEKFLASLTEAVVKEVRKTLTKAQANAKRLDSIASRITTTDDLPPIGAVNSDISVKLDQVLTHMGIETPKAVAVKAIRTRKTAAKRR